MPLIICSKSVEKHRKYFEKKFKGKDVVVGIGGGSIIDKAKVLALPNRCIAIPTTASGAAFTSHAVVWDKEWKKDIKTPLPEYQKYPFKIAWSKDMAINTMSDCLAHIRDSYVSDKATKESKQLCDKAMKLLGAINSKKIDVNKIIEAGNLAGKAIEITGTGLIHKLSYPLTFYLGVPHGKACLEIIKLLKVYEQ